MASQTSVPKNSKIIIIRFIQITLTISALAACTEPEYSNSVQRPWDHLLLSHTETNDSQGSYKQSAIDLWDVNPALQPLDPLLRDGNEVDVSYGQHSQNILDFWLADTANLSPVAVFIHGGGFVAGDKRDLSPSIRIKLLAAGISVAAINYRFISTDPMPAPMLDAGRAIQFLRDKGCEWRIDPTRIGAFGASAGACICMWLGMHPDLADPESHDSVKRSSTRLQAIGSSGGQSSLDPLWILKWFPGGNTHLHPNLPLMYACTDFDELCTKPVRNLIEEMSAINHVSSLDPPIYMVYNQRNNPLASDAPPRDGIHHPMFGIKMKKALDEVGVEAVLVIRNEPETYDPYGSVVNFLVTKLLDPDYATNHHACDTGYAKTYMLETQDR
ncbi:MAG: alpha/beta hydrolase [Candidatus Marinimicrobia bacterium]|nr:alpha/beta hydrolase [Candidatus Neomarinimicrobiota bacterium]